MAANKGSRFYDDTWCIKHMPDLCWSDLLQEVERKKRLHEQRMNTEIAQINKTHNFIVGKKMEAASKRKKIRKNKNKQKPKDSIEKS